MPDNLPTDHAARMHSNQDRLASSLRRHDDIIVCGAGTSGCVIASRLAADPQASVLLLEAGRSDDTEFVSNIPTRLDRQAESPSGRSIDRHPDSCAIPSCSLSRADTESEAQSSRRTALGRVCGLLKTILSACWSAFVDGFAAYGCASFGHPLIELTPTRWCEDDLDELLSLERSPDESEAIASARLGAETSTALLSPPSSAPVSRDAKESSENQRRPGGAAHFAR